MILKWIDNKERITQLINLFVDIDIYAIRWSY